MRQFFPKEIKVHFNLRQPKSHHPTTVFLVVYVKNKQYKLPIGVKVYPCQWSKKYEQAIVGWKLNDNENNNNKIVNNKIKSIISQLSELFPYLCCADDIIPTIKNLLQTMGRRPKKEIDIIKVLLDGIDNDRALEDGTKVNKRNFVSHLQAFLESDEARPFKIKNFKDLAKTEVFEVFRNSIKRRPRTEGGSVGKEANLRVGFANKIVKNAKTLLKQYAVKNEIGFLTMTDITNIVLRLPKDHSDKDNKIFLRDDEVLKIYNYQCNDPKDEIVKDLFVLECTLGFRVSEIIKLKKYIRYDEDNGKIYVNFKPQKTERSKSKVDCIVYFDLAKEILKKYKDKDFPKVDIKGDYPRRIKKICEKCGLTDSTEQVKHYDEEEKARVLTNKKYELISSHTGRHTFIVLMLLRKFPLEEIQRFTGHKSYDMILYYSKRLTQIDYDNFEQQKKEHPEQVLLPFGKADNGGLDVVTPPSMQAPQKTFGDDIDQLQRLLISLGDNGKEVFKTNNLIDLQMMLDERVKVLCEELCEKYGDELGREMYRRTKIVWYMEDIPIQEKCTKIINIIDNGLTS